MKWGTGNTNFHTGCCIKIGTQLAFGTLQIPSVVSKIGEYYLC